MEKIDIDNIQLVEIAPTKKLKVGDFFGLRAKQLSTLTIFNSDLSDVSEYADFRSEEFGKDFSTSGANDLQELKYRYLIFKYLGNGRCQECYTSKIVNLISESAYGVLNNKTGLNIARFVNIYNNPLAIDLSSKDSVQLFEVTDTFKLLFTELNSGNETEIKAGIQKLESEGKTKLAIAMSEMLDFDQRMAYTENVIYNLEKEVKTLK